MRKLKAINWICYITYLFFIGICVYRLISTSDIIVAKIYAFACMIGMTIVMTINTLSTINR